LPLLAIVALATLVTGAIQGGLVPSLGLLTPRAERISPLAGIRRLFSMQGLMQTVRTLAKVAVIAVVSGLVVLGHLSELTHLGSSQLSAALDTTMRFAWELGFKVAIALFVLGMLDWLWERRRFLRRIRMTRQELKEELRESEGDPQVRARQRQRREQLVREML